MPTALEQLKTMTVVVADTGDIHSIEKYRPRDATTNPSRLITAAAQMPEYAPIVDGALTWALAQSSQATPKPASKAARHEDVVKRAIDRLAVEFGLRILKIVRGRVSTEVDARLSFDTKATVEKAHSIIKQYEAAGASKKPDPHQDRFDLGGHPRRRAAREGGHPLQLDAAVRHAPGDRVRRSGRHAHLAVRGSDSRLVQEVDRQRELPSSRRSWRLVGDEDLQLLQTPRAQDRGHGGKLPQPGRDHQLAGCDLLTIAPSLLAELEASSATLARKLDPKAAAGMTIDKIPMDEATFRKMHETDRMAHEKLEEGIAGFSKALVALEKQLAERLALIEGEARGAAARDLFKVYDYDGDGFITREEWGGTDTVFDALDHDRDGRITPEELAAGLGAAFRLQ